jgi:hypothetical protein
MFAPPTAVFCNGGRYAHLSDAQKGFRGYIYAILDLIDPKRPRVPKGKCNYVSYGDAFPGPLMGATEDVLAEGRGNMFVNIQHAGLRVLPCTF